MEDSRRTTRLVMLGYHGCTLVIGLIIIPFLDFNPGNAHKARNAIFLVTSIIAVPVNALALYALYYRKPAWLKAVSITAAAAAADP